MSVSAPSFFFNPLTQRILSQSNNVSYLARGVYRVHDTEGNRKGDYWFRDVAMTLACAYMTELSFRGTEVAVTMPLLTEALKLDKLSKNPLYTKAWDYTTLPELARQHLMGSLVQKSSTSLVPNLMKQQFLAQQLRDLPEQAQQMLTSPTHEADALVNKHLAANGLTSHGDEIRRIAAIENPTQRQDAITRLVVKHPKLNAKQVANAAKLEEARQMGILIDHMHRHINVSEYVKEQFAIEHPLSGTVADTVKDCADRLSALQTKGKTALPALLDEVYKLPVDKREEAFHKGFEEILGSLELKKGVLLASPQEYQYAHQFGKQIRPLLQEQNRPETLEDVTKHWAAFYDYLAENKSKAVHLQTLWRQAGPNLHTQLSKQVEEALTEATKPHQSGPERKTAFHKKLDELKLEQLFSTEAEQTAQQRLALQSLKENVSHILESHPNGHMDDTTLKQARSHVTTFMNTITTESDQLISRLVKPQGAQTTGEAFQAFIVQSMKSKPVAEAIGKIQRSGTWPKMAATILLNLVFYGFLATNFDNHILQPFQAKLAKERGTAQDIVTAGYQAMIPAALVLSQLFDKVSLPAIRRMGYFTRFALVGGGALATFAGSAYGLLMHRLKKPPEHKPTEPSLASTGKTAQQYAPALPATTSFSPTASPFSTRFNNNPVGKFNGFGAPLPHTAHPGFALPTNAGLQHNPYTRPY